VQTLIIHRDGDRVCHLENARWLARNVPGARYVELQGIDHASFAGKDDIVPEIQKFLTVRRELPVRGKGAAARVTYRSTTTP
jgi:pimeloyl-ACP methyl ester carboxylesterase